MIQQILLSITFVYAPLFLLTRTKIFNKHLCLPFESLSLTNNKTVLGNITLLLDIVFLYFSLCYQSYYWLFK